MSLFGRDCAHCTRNERNKTTQSHDLMQSQSLYERNIGTFLHRTFLNIWPALYFEMPNQIVVLFFAFPYLFSLVFYKLQTYTPKIYLKRIEFAQKSQKITFTFTFAHTAHKKNSSFYVMLGQASASRSKKMGKKDQ